MARQDDLEFTIEPENEELEQKESVFDSPFDPWDEAEEAAERRRDPLRGPTADRV